MKKLSITDASAQQLATFAKNIQQIDNVPSDPGAITAALVESGWTHDYILVGGDEAPLDLDNVVQLDQLEEAGERPAEMPSGGFSFWTSPAPGKPPCPMVTLKVLSTDRPGGNDPAAPIINNSPPLVIQRNRLVRIPYDFYLALKQAGGTALRPNPSGTGDMVGQDYSEYPMTDVKLPTRSEVDAWNAWAGQHELGKPKAAQAA